MTKYKHVFSPIKFGTITIKNRIEAPPMLAGMATPDGYVTREMIEFYGSFARGGSGIVTVGDAAVDFDYARGHFGQLNLGDDKVIGGLGTLVEAVQKYGAKLSVELNHTGNLASPRVLNGRTPIGPSPILAKGDQLSAIQERQSSILVTEMTQAMIDQVIHNFASACERCLTAGLEMVMIHGAHGHLLSQFVSPFSNKRKDKYGGDLGNRARFVIELLDAVRSRVGKKLAIEYRISGDELIPEGMHEEETIEFIKLIQDKIDLIHVSLANIADPAYVPYMAQPTYFPHAYNVHRAEKIRKAVIIPVTCVGSIISLEMAEKILAEGKADIVAMARAQVAEPEIVNKTLRGELDEIRPCVRCNICGERPSFFFPVRCAVNPVTGRELEYRYLRPADKPKKVVIIGGGPAGLEAAIIASSRGHQVTLYEKENELGGALRYASGPSFKVDMHRYLDWLVNKAKTSPLKIKLSSKANISSIKQLNPDVLILAVGADPIIPDITGIKSTNVALASDVDIDNIKTGSNVIVVGAGLTGCETALHLAQQGKKVKIIDMVNEAEIAKDATMVSRITLLRLLEQHAAEFIMEVKLEEVTDKGIIVTDIQGNRREIAADTVVLAMGVKSRYETVESFQDLAKEVYVIGDCFSPRNLMAAIHDAFNVAAEL